VGSGGPEHWPVACNTATESTLKDCNFAVDYRALLEVIKGVGPTPTTMPEVSEATGRDALALLTT